MHNLLGEVPEAVRSFSPDWLDPAKPAGALAYGVVFLFLAWLVGRILGLAVEGVLKRPRQLHLTPDPTAIKFLGQLARVVVYVFAFVSYAHLVPALQSIGRAWLASVGVVSVVFGLAAQNTLGNLVAGISILLYRPFNLGDHMQVSAPTGMESGVVESLNLGYTILRTLDDRRIVIPNSTMASQTSVNLSLVDQRLLCVVPFNFTYDVDVEKARAILLDLAHQLSKDSPAPECPVTALGGGALTLTLKVWTTDYQAATQLKYDLFEAANKRFKADAIELK
jgi:small-conductance mechanosensitive channel